MKTCRSLLLPAILCAAPLWLPGQSAVVHIGVVFDGPAADNNETFGAYEQEISALLGEEFDVLFPEEKRLVADWTAEGVEDAVGQLLSDPEVDQVLTLGLIGSYNLAGRGPLPKPGHAALVYEPRLLGLPIEETPDGLPVSGVENLVYIAGGGGIERDLVVFRDLAPVTRLAIFYLDAIGSVIPDAPRFVAERLRQQGIEATPVPVGSDPAEALAAIPVDTEAVYLTRLPRLSDSDLRELIDTLNERRLPTFSSTGRDEVEMGVLATVAEGNLLVRRARRVAMNMQAVLGGTPAAELPVDFDTREHLVINMATARAIGFSPPFRVLLEADALNEEPAVVGRSLSLESIVREAEGANLDLAAADRGVAAGLQLAKLARAALLPQLDLTGGANAIDKDRAQFGAGQNPQRLAFGTLSGSQLLYSDDVWASYKIENRLQDAREEGRAALRLDIIQEAAETYLNVLRAKTVERVRADNLSLTRSNLEMARVRVEIGQAGREELFRWESQEAENKRDLVDARAFRSEAEIALNRVLNRPIEEGVGTVETGLDDPLLVTGFRRLEPYVNAPAAFAHFRDFMAVEAFAQSPELRQLEAEVLARRREVTASERSFYVPRVSASASGTYLGRYGAGSEPEGLLGSLFFTNPWNWQIGVTGSLPVFLGGAQRARLKLAREELQRTTLERDATRQRIEERLRSAVYQTGASYLGIELAQDAAAAAQRNLELVQERYGEGIAGILVLLDAQNQALLAELAAANAIFDHLVDLMRLQRAIGRFDYYRSVEDREDFLRRMDEFYKEAGYEVREP